MNIENACNARDLVLTWYICDDQYTGDRIESHIKECEDDWNVEEIDKPVSERIPLPKPTRDFLKLYEKAKQLAKTPIHLSENNSEKEESSDKSEEEDEEDEEEEEESEEEDKDEEEDNFETYNEASEEIQTKDETKEESKDESSLVSCPNWNRTFFPERLSIHLKSCKPGKPMTNGIKKKTTYQPPKLKTKTKWKPPKKNNDLGDENYDIEEKKVKTPKKKPFK